MDQNNNFDTPSPLPWCKYYKGEPDSQCPYENGTKSGLFWYIEKKCCQNMTTNPAFLDGWKYDLDSYIKNNPDEKNALTDSSLSYDQRAFILYLEAMIEKWTPYHLDWVFDY